MFAATGQAQPPTMSSVSDNQRPEPASQRGAPESTQFPGSNVNTGAAAANSPLQPQHDNAANPTAPSGETRSRPIFKMRRTGHSGMFPFSDRPSLPASLGSEGTQSAAPQPSSHSSPRLSDFPPRKRKHVESAESGSATQNRNQFVSVVVPKTGVQPNETGGSEATRVMEFIQSATEARYGKRAPTPKSVRSDEDELPDLEVPTPHIEQEASHSRAGTQPFRPTIPPDLVVPTPPAEREASYSPTVTQSFRSTIAPDLEVPTPPAEQEASHRPAVTQSFRSTIPPDVQQIFRSALDDRLYKTWTDESGQLLSTAGALLPPGYQKSDNPVFPWLCPVRSCRKLLPSLPGLGKHFCNSHRATRFNDNLDGTLTDLGLYADPAHGNGKRSSTGFAKPSLIVSKRPMGLDESPMAEVTYHQRHQQSISKGTVPKRGGPSRQTNAPTEEPADGDFGSDISLREATPQDQPQQLPPPVDSPDKLFEMANPDRPYNKWLGPSGEPSKTHGALLPDGYKLDATLADRPWICPIRSCRRLFLSIRSLGHHFAGSHMGCRLNDNLDGTFTILPEKDAGPPVVASRMPMDVEEVVEPKRPTYPGASRKNVVWVNARAADETLARAQMETTPDPAPVLPPNSEERDWSSDTDLGHAADGRPYRQWWDASSGDLASMTGALIPEGYQLDKSVPSRPWICPLRSCRLACKTRWSLGWHFQKTHQFEDLNDNRDGTFSIVGSHKQNRACVVSRNRPGPDEPPALDPCFPLTTAESRVAERQREDLRVPTRTPSLGTASSTALTRNENIVNASGSADLWNYLCSQIGAQIPSPEIPALKLLLGLPRVRDLDTTRPLSAGLSADLNDKQIAGLIIQVTGEDAPSRCTECRRHNGPFRSCIRPSREVAQDISGFLRSSLRACGNCFVRKNSHACSVKSMAATGLKSAARNQSRDGDTPMADAPLSLHESMLGRRRSSRLFLANTEHEGDAEDEESGNEAPAPDSRPSRRLVTMKVTRPVQQAQPPSQKRAAVKETTAPPEADLHMEDWEMADGRVNSTTSDNALAFSSTYLTTNQTVPIAPSITFQAVTIPSGRGHQFPADASKTRVCTLAGGGGGGGGGKLGVRVGAAGDDDDEEAFVIGAGGAFKIAPGVGCSATNRCYVDVVLHVTSVSV